MTLQWLSWWQRYHQFCLLAFVPFCLYSKPLVYLRREMCQHQLVGIESNWYVTGIPWAIILCGTLKKHSILCFLCHHLLPLPTTSNWLYKQLKQERFWSKDDSVSKHCKTHSRLDQIQPLEEVVQSQVQGPDPCVEKWWAILSQEAPYRECNWQQNRKCSWCWSKENLWHNCDS